MNAASLRNPDQPIGLYVHVPFCRHLCPYCDFAVAVRREPPFAEYTNALLGEWGARRSAVQGRAIRSLYFGGGTPAMWPTAELSRFVEQLRSQADLEPLETTVEANPHDITPAKLDEWAGCGIDRVSLGVQSFDDRYLSRLGRDHDGAVARRAAELVVADSRFRASIDLIYAGPSYSLELLRSDLEVIDELRPKHVSAYELTVEQGTVFERRHARGELNLPADSDRFGADLADQLAAIGYERYEVSSFGRDGDRSIHNSGYWLGAEYLGLGMGAHSLALDEVPSRRANNRRLKEYLRSPVTAAEAEELTAAEYLGERLFLGARTRTTQSWAELRSRFSPHVSEEILDAVEVVWAELVSEGLFEQPPRLEPTDRGLDFADWIGGRFWDAVTRETTR